MFSYHCGTSNEIKYMRRILSKIFFIGLMVLMALFLAVSATLICAVKILHSERLTPLVERMAGNMLDADVSVARVEFAFEPAFPMLRLCVDSLSVRSHAFDSLTAEQRAGLPAWSDSLFAVERFSGSVDVGAIISRGAFTLRDVEFVRPAVNIVIAHSGIGNFDIYTPDTTATVSDTPLVIPPLSINRLAFIEPEAMRYFNAVDSTDATIVLLHNALLENAGEPAYSLRIDGNVNTPYVRELIDLEDISFGLDGRLRWSPSSPMRIEFEQFAMRGAFVEARLNAAVDMDSSLTVSSAALDVVPIKIKDILSAVPDSLRKTYRLVSPYFDTDGAVALKLKLLRPYRTDIDSMPAFDMNIAMADASLRYGKANFRKIGFDLSARLDSGGIDDIKLDINRLTVAGPATTLNLEGNVTNLLSDPAFDLCLRGNIDLKLLPPVVTNMAQGYLSGIVDTDIDVKGRMSMLSAEKFHNLYASGKMHGRNLYYLSDDTSKMVDIPHVGIALTSSYRERDSLGNASAPMFAAGLKVDTATMLLGGTGLSVGSLALGAGVENTVTSASKYEVVPFGGGLKVGYLNVESVTDSAGARFRDIAGHVKLQRFNGAEYLPELVADLSLGRVAAGTQTTRFLLADGALKATLHKKPMSEAARKETRQLVDSIRRVHPDLSVDSVIQLAIEKRRENHRKIRRIGIEHGDNDVEMLEWNLASGFRKFLLGWELEGKLSTSHARMFTPYFPLRNRITHLDLRFSNDSISVEQLSYKAGHSDMAINGLISNIKRALTRKTDNTLKLNIELESDTVDINQLSAAAFAGAAYADRIRRGEAKGSFGSDDDDTLEKELDAMMSQQADSVAPLLVPVNIDGRVNLKADNVLYGDLMMKNLRGELLAYNGSVNLHKLSASSDAGAIDLSALYFAPRVSDMHFGFSLDMKRMKIERFLKLVPAVDSVLPIMRGFSGIIDAGLAATVDIDSTMNMVLPTLDAAVKLTGDSLAFIDKDTYATLGKWLRFRDRADNKIKHMRVEMLVRDNLLRIFPFAFDIDRYRLGINGYNDLALNFDYHISVLKSPLPFKFGINIKGNPDKYKIRLGGAKYKEGSAAESVAITDTARVNLIRQIENVFRRGVKESRFKRLDVNIPDSLHNITDSPEEGFSAADSLLLRQEGLIDIPTDETISK